MTPAGFPIAHLKAFAPRFSGNMSKMLVLLKLGVPAPAKASSSGIVILKKAVLKAFFGRKLLLTAKPFTFDYIVLYIVGKL